jgi:hypothetical protein
MNGIITGNIASLAEQIKSVLDKQVKAGQCITIKDNIDEKQLTISISVVIENGIAKDVAKDIAIYNVVRDGILYMYIFHNIKKGKKHIDSRDLKLIPDRDRDIVINYKDAIAYNITLAGKVIANISKNLKKHKLEMITKLNNSHTLYKFMNKYLFMIDTNGTLFYYPDSIDIIPLKTWVELFASKNNLAHTLDDNTLLSNTLLTNTAVLGNTTLNKYLLLNKFVSLECHLDTNAYGLYDILGNSSLSGNVAITSSTDIQSPNTLGAEKCNPEFIDTTTNDSYSAIGYILSWLNPLSYYTSNTSNTSSLTSSNQEKKNITIPHINKDIDDIDKDIDKDIDIDIDKQNTSYFLDTSSQTYDLIKIQDKQVKRLKARQIEIPAFITDITIDNVDNIMLSGRIDNQPINMKYNKYMIGMHLV